MSYTGVTQRTILKLPKIGVIPLTKVINKLNTHCSSSFFGQGLTRHNTFVNVINVITFPQKGTKRIVLRAELSRSYFVN